MSRKQGVSIHNQQCYVPTEDSPIDIETITGDLHDDLLKQAVEEGTKIHQRRKFAIAFARTHDGEIKCLTARAHAVIGYSMHKPEDMLVIEQPQEKYSFIQEPVNRLLMNLRRYGMELIDGYFYCSQVPTSREQVNLAGAGIRRITIGDIQKCRDPHGIEAMELLNGHSIVDYV